MTVISQDLRQRIVETYAEGEGSIRQLAKRFKVCTSTVFKLQKQYRETGDLTPKPKGGSKPKQTTPENLDIIREILTKNNDATLSELCDLMNKVTGQNISITSMHRLIEKLGWTRKKDYARHRAKKPSRNRGKKEL
jgi:transposase